MLIDAAAAQVADGFTLAGHRGSVTVVQLVLLGLFYEFTGQVEEEFLHVVGLLGRGLQVEHALGLGKVLGPLPENLPLLGQIYFITWWTESSRLSPCVRREGGKSQERQTSGGRGGQKRRCASERRACVGWMEARTDWELFIPDNKGCFSET